MIQKKLIIYGVGHFAEYAAFLFEHDSEYKVIGYCMESSYLEKSKTSRIQADVIAFEDLEQRFPAEDYALFIAVGNNKVRERIFMSAEEKGYSFATYLSSKAEFWHPLEIGENSLVGEGCIIQPLVKIGTNTIVFGSKIGHHSVLGNHVLASGCTLAGNVRVGDFSFLGLNVAVKENVVIAEKNIIGMGSVISFHTEPKSVYSSPTAVKRKTKYDNIQDFI